MSPKLQRFPMVTEISGYSRFVQLKSLLILLGLVASSNSFAGAGDLDLTYGEGGKVVTDIPQAAWASSKYRSSPSIVQSDGKILVASETKLWRLGFDGGLDQSFGSWGEADLGPVWAKALALQPDGKVIVGVNTIYRRDWGLVRVLSDGSLDPSFGNNGTVTADFGATTGGESKELIEAVFVRDDGRILLVGAIFNGPGLGGGIGLMMFGPNGEIDPTFGDSGRQFFEPDALATLAPADWSAVSEPLQSHLMRVAEQDDGKLVIVSVATSVNKNDTAYLFRLNVDGSIDMAFGQSGISTIIRSEISRPRLRDITIGQNGKILLLVSDYLDGWSGNPSLLAFNADGKSDQSFGIAGIKTVDLSVFGEDPPSFDYLAVYATGSFVLGGTRRIYEYGSDGLLMFYNDMAALKLKPDASIDTDFGSDGIVALSLSEYRRQLYTKSINLLDDNKIVIAGPINHFPRGATKPSSDDIALVRLEPNGAEDNTFGIGGKKFLTAHKKSDNGAQDVVLSQADGKIVVAGFKRGEGLDFGLARYNDDGSLDPSFGGQGYVSTDLRSFFDSTRIWGAQTIIYDDSISAIAMQADGKIVAAGSSRLFRLDPRPRVSFALVRYENDGGLDSSFGEDGIVLTDFLPDVEFEPAAVASDMVLQPDAKIIVVGTARNRPGGGPYEDEMAIARYNPDGRLDDTFGEFGQLTINRAMGYDEYARAVALQEDGKLIVAGFYRHHHFWIDDDGLQLVRLNADGTLDPSFGNGGIVITDIGKVDEIADIAIQQDGRIVIGGVTYRAGTGWDMLLARYETNGSLDASFGFNGYRAFDFGDNWPGALPNGADEINSVKLQSDGRIIAAGYTGRWIEDPASKNKHFPLYTPSYDFALLRFEENGSLDYSFGYGGKTTTSFGTNFSVGRSSGIQADGKILVVGEVARDLLPDTVDMLLYDYDSAIARFEGINTSLDELDALIFYTQDMVRAGIVNEGQANALQAKLRGASQQIDRGNVNAAVQQLEAFVNQASALASEGVIPASEASFLIEEATALIDNLLT